MRSDLKKVKYVVDEIERRLGEGSTSGMIILPEITEGAHIFHYCVCDKVIHMNIVNGFNVVVRAAKSDFGHDNIEDAVRSVLGCSLRSGMTKIKAKTLWGVLEACGISSDEIPKAAQAIGSIFDEDWGEFYDSAVCSINEKSD